MSGDWFWITEYVRPWLATGGILITNGIAVKAYVVWQKGRTDAARLALDRDKLDVDGDKIIRDHYATELASLREQVIKSGEGHAQRFAASEERHQAAMKKADERFDAAQRAADERETQCEAKVSHLRDIVTALTEEVTGLRKILGQSSRSAIILAAQTPSATVRDAADRAASEIETLTERLHDLPHTEAPK